MNFFKKTNFYCLSTLYHPWHPRSQFLQIFQISLYYAAQPINFDQSFLTTEKVIFFFIYLRYSNNLLIFRIVAVTSLRSKINFYYYFLEIKNHRYYYYFEINFYFLNFNWPINDEDIVVTIITIIYTRAASIVLVLTPFAAVFKQLLSLTLFIILFPYIM